MNKARDLEFAKRIQENSTDVHSLRKRGHFGSLFSASQYHLPYQLVRAVAPRQGRVLDWGCGNGHFTRFLLEEGYTDIHTYSFRAPALLDGLSQLQDRVTIHVAAKAKGSHIRLPSSCFQTVLSIGVLEHVRETGGTELESLREIHRILTDGGRLICCHLPNRRSPIEALSRLLPGRYHHQYLFSRKQITTLLETEGFTVERITLYGALPRNLFSGRLRFVGNQPFLCRFLESLDWLLSRALRPFCQNIAVVARKTSQE
ncbi:MAG: methyltransferase domain-containing protein [Synechococcus sp.]|nr:methyltransferase domain-containing protein [Synechococcus sp.]